MKCADSCRTSRVGAEGLGGGLLDSSWPEERKLLNVFTTAGVKTHPVQIGQGYNSHPDWLRL